LVAIGFILFILGITAYGRYQVIYDQYQICISDNTCQSFDCGPPRIGHCPPYADPSMTWQLTIGTTILILGLVVIIRSLWHKSTKTSQNSQP